MVVCVSLTERVFFLTFAPPSQRA